MEVKNITYSKKKTAVKAVKYPVIVLSLVTIASAVLREAGVHDAEVLGAAQILIAAAGIALLDVLKHRFHIPLP